jgi:type IV secretion system protein VirB3
MSRNHGIDLDALYVGPTRPTTIAGVTWPAVVLNIIVTIETFVFTHNLLWLLIFVPIHGICYLICLHDPRTFELLALWGQTKGQSVFNNRWYWGAATCSALEIQTRKKPSRASRRRLKELSK